MKYTKLRELIDKKDLDLGKLSTVHTSMVREMKHSLSASPHKQANPNKMTPKSTRGDSHRGGQGSTIQYIQAFSPEGFPKPNPTPWIKRCDKCETKGTVRSLSPKQAKDKLKNEDLTYSPRLIARQPPIIDPKVAAKKKSKRLL